MADEETQETEEEQPNLTEALAEEMSEEEEPQPEPEAEVPTTEEEPAEEPEEEQAATVKVGDRDFTPEGLEQLAQLSEWTERNPEVYDRLLDWQLKGIPAPEELFPPDQPPVDGREPKAEPEWVEPEERIARLEGMWAAFQKQQDADWKANFNAAIADGVEEFREKYPNLSDVETSNVIATMRDLETLPPAMGRYRARPSRGVAEALEVAHRYLAFPRVQEDLQKTSASNVKEMRTRRAAASASPVNASAPRQEPLAETKDERQAQMVSEIREALES